MFDILKEDAANVKNEGLTFILKRIRVDVLKKIKDSLSREETDSRSELLILISSFK